MHKKDYPLTVAKDIRDFLIILRQLAIKYEDIVNTKNDEKFLFYFKDIERPEFYFAIYTPNQTSDGRTFYNFNYVPENEHSFSKTSYNNVQEEVLSHFGKWISLLQAYNEIDFTESGTFEKFYAEEFYADFDIMDEDADQNPFEHSKQLFFYKYLTYLKTALEQSDIENPIKNELQSEIIELRENIQSITKRAFIRKLSKLFGKIKKHSLKTMNDVYDVAKKRSDQKAFI